MKKNVLFVVLFVGLIFSVFGQSESDFSYYVENGGITITRYKGSVKDVVIPERISGFNVVAIADLAFMNNQLTSITLPSSITSIGSAAFQSNQLTSITLPNSITSIGSGVFMNNQLTSITLPNSITSIGSAAFMNNQLTSITLPNSITSIGSAAFADNKLTSIILPNSITSIGNFAFRNNQLTSIDLPDNIDLQPSSFHYCSVYDIYIKNGKNKSIFTISLSTFNDFEIAILDNAIVEIIKYKGSIKDVRIPEKINNMFVVAIGGFAFNNRYNQLTSITLPNSITSIGSWAFANNQLTSITLPNSITFIESQAFRNNQLTSVVIPKSVVNLADNAFDPNVIITRQ